MPAGIGFLGGTAIAVMGTLVAVGAAVYEAGAIDVRVHENHAKGTNLHLIAPAALVPVGLEFVPDKVFRKCGPQVRPWLPAIKVAVEELQKYSDVTFVEVEDGHDHVTIKKLADKMVIDVNSPDETVHVAVPLKTIKSVLKKIEAANPET